MKGERAKLLSDPWTHTRSVDAVLFDMDGVLVNSVAYKYDHWDEVLRETYGLRDVETDELVGLNVNDKYDYLVDAHGIDAEREAVVGALTEDADRIYRERVDLLTGVESTLDWLAERSLATGLVSASGRSSVESVVTRFDLDDRFDVVVSTDDITGDSKPDPAIYRHAASALGVEPTSCLAVEDSPHGVTAASRAGAYVLGYAPPDSPDRDIDHADEVVTTSDGLCERTRALVREENATTD